ncbi:MAG: Gfo/Idh/MocA family oxidoreductase [Cyanobacteria bacterium P01_E01_bin.45]
MANTERDRGTAKQRFMRRTIHEPLPLWLFRLNVRCCKGLKWKWHTLVVRVGIVGTGFAARLRAKSLLSDNRCQLVAITGRTPHRVQDFASKFGAQGFPTVEALLSGADVDLVFVSTINSHHASATQRSLEAGKHTVVEYPIAFDLEQARSLIGLAQHRQKLLHVEHVELLSGIHQTLKQEVPALGQIGYVQYTTIAAAQPAPNRWSYNPSLFGFPLVGAVSRIHRLVDLLGAVERVSCQLRYDGPNLPTTFSSCVCSAQLAFTSGAIADLTYAKGEHLWRSRRTIELHGSRGSVQLGGQHDVVVRADGERTISVGSRRGLFYRDTHEVIQHILTGEPLYIKAADSLHSLEVALAAQTAAQTNQTVCLI